MTDRPRSSATGALSRLTAVSRALTYAVSIDEVLDITVECASELLDAPRVVLMLTDDDHMLQIRAARGVDPEAVERFRAPLDETLIGRLTAVMGSDAKEGFLGVPLVVRGGVTGLLAVLRGDPANPDEREEWLLSALADQAAVALENARAETGRSELQEQLESLQAEDERRQEALRMVGHDLRSPLSALQGYVHLLETENYGPVNEAQRTALKRLETIGRHLDALLSNVMEMGRLATGAVTLEHRIVGLEDLVDDAVAMVALHARERGVEVTTDVPEDLRVLAAPDRLRQVLVQLLDNAVKFAPDGTAVAVSAERESGDPERVAIRVADQGPGVPPEDARAIFEPYRQIDDGRSTSGMGLGLAIGRLLVEHMDGTLEVEESGDEGTTFVLRLLQP